MIARSWFESALEGSWLFPFFGEAEGAEGFEDFGDVGGFGAEELFGEGFGGDWGVSGAESGFDGFGALGEGFGPGVF